jgi:hypothetical protein
MNVLKIEKNYTDVLVCHQLYTKITVSEMFETLNTLDFNPCPGPDGIPNILLCSCKYSL